MLSFNTTSNSLISSINSSIPFSFFLLFVLCFLKNSIKKKAVIKCKKFDYCLLKNEQKIQTHKRFPIIILLDLQRKSFFQFFFFFFFSYFSPKKKTLKNVEKNIAWIANWVSSVDLFEFLKNKLFLKNLKNWMEYR